MSGRQRLASGCGSFGSPGQHVGSDGGELLPGGKERVRNLFHICGNPPEEVTVILTVREAHADTKIFVSTMARKREREGRTFGRFELEPCLLGLGGK
ncbi:hypothetical protein NPIL_457471 [Nephila pilipes]|uniref:Uncharacterized protein n=1 Tax=Nephila pilipes TaxID=299642 RepID=A0A8X6QF10_NEPPI|nr:hypothetical protein NPIL_457471 [Nephila pilipes]